MGEIIICLKCHKKEKVDSIFNESHQITIKNLYDVLDYLKFELCHECTKEFMKFVKGFISLKED